MHNLPGPQFQKPIKEDGVPNGLLPLLWCDTLLQTGISCCLCVHLGDGGKTNPILHVWRQTLKC